MKPALSAEAYIDTTRPCCAMPGPLQGIDCEISGRSKHIYSMLREIKRKRCSIGELYDIRAVRVMVDEVKDCYAALGVMHSMFQPVPGQV